MRMCLYTCMYVCVGEYVCVYVYIGVCICIYVYVYTYMYVYVCLYNIQSLTSMLPVGKNINK